MDVPSPPSRKLVAILYRRGDKSRGGAVKLTRRQVRRKMDETPRLRGSMSSGIRLPLTLDAELRTATYRMVLNN